MTENTQEAVKFSKKTKEEIERFAREFVGKESDFVSFTAGKIINDAVWGTHKFHPFELSIIALPIVQRLRQIRQMGFVNYVYPSAIHTRFEHTLGVAILSNKLFEYAKKEGERYLDSNDRVHIRIAALLHDIGHGMFSHTSEEIYGDSLRGMIEVDVPDADPKPHEYIAYLLLHTDAFRNFFKWLSKTYRMSINLDVIANFIIGNAPTNEQRFKVSFVNGPFDADKLDYIYRDSKFSGIPLLLDLDRLMHEIAISDLSDTTPDEIVKDLTIGISGVSSVEQIVFNKMLLFATIYHHQKVKACDCMFKGVFEYIKTHGQEFKFREMSLKFEMPTDFLWFSDIDFMAEGIRNEDPEIHRMIHNIVYRRPLKRAIVISRKTVDDGLDNFDMLMSTSFNKKEKNEELRETAREIWKNAGEPCSFHDVWVDIPKPPSFKEADCTYVRTNRTSNDTDLKRLTEFFPTNQWTHQYNTHKLKGHVFAPEDCISKIAKSAIDVFKNKYSIKFKKEAVYYCKNAIED